MRTTSRLLVVHNADPAILKIEALVKQAQFHRRI
jgi:hypothetical protein